MTRFGFVAGQWLSFKTNKPDGEEITRAYSIASPPGDDNRFALCLNRVQDGFMSNFLCDMKEGDEISCQGPFRRLHPAAAAARHHLHRHRHRRRAVSIHAALAAGRSGSPSGETTLAAVRQPDGRRHLLSRRVSETRRPASNFHYLPTLSRGADEWQGLRGYVQEHVPGIVQGRADMHAYICGLDKMIKANRELLKGLGWDRKSILYEKYD